MAEIWGTVNGLPVRALAVYGDGAGDAQTWAFAGTISGPASGSWESGFEGASWSLGGGPHYGYPNLGCETHDATLTIDGFGSEVVEVAVCDF